MDADELDIDKSKTVPIDLSRLSNVVDNDVVKKTVHDNFFTKFNNIELVNFFKKLKMAVINQI